MENIVNILINIFNYLFIKLERFFNTKDYKIILLFIN